MRGEVFTQAPAFNLTAQWTRAGEDVLVLVTGGERPHIGAVAMAEPRPSLADPARLSATVSVFCYLGHKEDEVARALAQVLAAGLGVKAVVAAGMHWDGIGPEQIESVVHNARDLGHRLLRALSDED